MTDQTVPAVRTSPAPARTDVPAPAPSVPPRVEPAPPPASSRAAGATLAVGATAFAATMFVTGADATGLAARITDVAGLVFQIGLVGLLLAALRTGVGRIGRGIVRGEMVVLGLAMVWSVLDAVLPTSLQEAPWMLVLDMCWPLSMLGMAIVGVTVAVTGRWRGVLRAWTPFACVWVLLSIPLMTLGEAVGGAVAAGHMIVGFGVLGALLALRPELTRR